MTDDVIDEQEIEDEWPARQLARIACRSLNRGDWRPARVVRDGWCVALPCRVGFVTTHAEDLESVLTDDQSKHLDDQGLTWSAWDADGRPAET